MTFRGAQLELPLAGSALPLPRGSALWIIAADGENPRHIREHLLAAGRDDRGAFFVREADGASPFGPDCLVGIHDEGMLHLFAPPRLASPQLPSLLSGVFSSGDVVPVQSAFEDLLLLRLWGNGAPTTNGSQADGHLGRGLSRLQTSDRRSNPHVFRAISAQLLEWLEHGASTGLRGMLRRAWAASVMEAAASLGNRDAGLAAAWEGLKLATGEFEEAGLASHAERCASEAEALGAQLRAANGCEPFLPGLSLTADAPVPLPRTAFRSFRCIGIRVPCPVAVDPGGPDEPPLQAGATALVEAGCIALRDLRLGAVLAATSYPGLVPRARALPTGAVGGDGRIRVWLDEEHRALLHLPIGRAATLGHQTYVLSVQVRGRTLEPPFRAARQGRPADFHAKFGRLPGTVTVRVSVSGHRDSFRVPVG